MPQIQQEIIDLCQALDNLQEVDTGNSDYECHVCGGSGELEGIEVNDTGKLDRFLCGFQAFGIGEELNNAEKFLDTFHPRKLHSLLTYLNQDAGLSDEAIDDINKILLNDD